jgi:hypothetical protein
VGDHHRWIIFQRRLVHPLLDVHPATHRVLLCGTPIRPGPEGIRSDLGLSMRVQARLLDVFRNNAMVGLDTRRFHGALWPGPHGPVWNYNHPGVGHPQWDRISHLWRCLTPARRGPHRQSFSMGAVGTPADQASGTPSWVRQLDDPALTWPRQPIMGRVDNNARTSLAAPVPEHTPG